ncbi:hypothetical protein A9404_10165 [Halothiobacillus diazotrophicus]|uniref:Cytochrome c domain-containing protein n=1 Tax=Halothiobacillus diazotrophicus TaxID=1860122 RepID=A0A191ZIL2_9GAMM|nr:hypothetical protein [Halothiobacillus diazotrophicus]ANJ67692.1 hypothetical protein A9404_10165 [Halothiobacillus diazotrophicus]
MNRFSPMNVLRGIRPLVAAALWLPIALSASATNPAEPSAEKRAETGTPRPIPLRGEFISRDTFANPHAHIPAQCYIETGHGTQSACLFCHTNGVAALKLGNNNPQAGANPNIGNLQADYAFGVVDYPFVVNSSINPWINTLKPEVLRTAVSALGEHPDDWDMQSYIRQDNWQAAFAQRPGSVKDWDPKVASPFRLFPGLNPADLPADDDGFVRTTRPADGFFKDARGHITGWRAINFMPYGIFTPLAGSVSGIYIRLPAQYMMDEENRFDIAVYKANLDRVERNIQDRLAAGETHYVGAAKTVAIVRGQYPLGTEFAHPLHYVDVRADGHDPAVSRFPGSRAQRVKEIRWMIKSRVWYPEEFGQGLKEETAPVYANRKEGWIENGTGWMLGGWIEDASGALRPQRPDELVQCVGCHSGNVRQSDIGQYPVFTSGTGNTIDSTWSLPRKLPGAAGWQEMNYLGYQANPKATADGTPGHLTTPEPVNRGFNQGEFRVFLDHVVGASLYGDMPETIERYLAAEITQAHGYSAVWPDLTTLVDRLTGPTHTQADKGRVTDQASPPETASDIPGTIERAQRQRLDLIREFTARGAYLDAQGCIRPELFLPTETQALAAARRYREVVVTQRYVYGKDVFPETPLALRYFRDPKEGFPHQDGRPYHPGDIITDRPINTKPGDFSYGMGITPTLIDTDKPFAQGGDFVGDYVPLLKP